MRTAMVARVIGGAALLALAGGGAIPVHAFHTVFSFEVDSFEADGNTCGPLDGSPGFVDHFDDGVLAPNWYNPYGTAYESGGTLFLTNPGTHFPTPLGGTADVSIAASAGSVQVLDGNGDFVATSWWNPIIPTEGNHFQMTVFTFGGGGGGGFYNEAFGIGVQNFAIHGGLGLEQHLTEINQSTGTYQNTMLAFHPIDASDVTGQIGLRVEFDDATNRITASVSLNGGATWLSPFPSATIFVGRTAAQFLLSSDPETAGATTTTTTPGGSTTTTTLPGGCDPTGCTRAVVPFRGRLDMKDKASPTADLVAWKLKKGGATTFADFGDPDDVTSYDVCLRDDGTGATIFAAAIPAGGLCGTKPCWKALGAKGWRYKDATGARGGVRVLHLKAGADGKSSVIVKGKGANLALPSLPLALPVTMRVRASTGRCWADTFTPAGVIRNDATQFMGKPGSPSGAFLDQPEEG
jgi:hypothetical protein